MQRTPKTGGGRALGGLVELFGSKQGLHNKYFCSHKYCPGCFIIEVTVHVHCIRTYNLIMPSKRSKFKGAQTNDIASVLKRNSDLENQIKQLTATLAELRSIIQGLTGTNMNTTPTQNPSPKGKGTNGTGTTQDASGELWEPVKTKGRINANKNRQEPRTAEKKPEVDAKADSRREDLFKLRPEDWKVDILKQEEIVEGARGVALVSVERAIQAHTQIKGKQKRLALLCPKDPMLEGKPGTQKKIKALDQNGKLVILNRYIVNIGTTEVQPKYYDDELNRPPVLNLQDDGKRVVIQMYEKLMTKMEFSLASKEPRKAVMEWLNHENMHRVRHVHQPVKKGDAGGRIIECVVIVGKADLRKILRTSGKNGAFVRPFHDKNDLEPMVSKICWLDEGVKLDAALAHANMIGEDALGVAVGKNARFGVRMPHDKFETRAKELIGDEKFAEVTGELYKRITSFLANASGPAVGQARKSEGEERLRTKAQPY